MVRAAVVVDDDPLVRMCTAEVMMECGFEIFEAEDADSAVRRLESEGGEVAVVVTDIRMPGAMDGVDLARLVRDRWPNIRILVMSGYDEGRRAKLPPGIRFLQKPWKARDVIDNVLDAGNHD
jgi:DNA-binding NtrC family response regulator